MRTALLVILGVVFSGSIVSVGKGLLGANVRSNQKEQVMERYRADPQGTLRNLRAGFYKCANQENRDIAGASDIRTYVAKNTVDAILLEAKGMSKAEVQKQLEKASNKMIAGFNKKAAVNANVYKPDKLLAYAKSMTKGTTVLCALRKAV